MKKERTHPRFKYWNSSTRRVNQLSKLGELDYVLSMISAKIADFMEAHPELVFTKSV